MVPRDESYKQSSRSNASTLQEVKGSHNIYFDQRTGKYYRKRTNPDWNWSKKDEVPSELYDELPAPPNGTAYFVGEGDFSYSNAYVQSNPGIFVKTTSYDSQADVEKYPQGKESLNALKHAKMVAIQHGINVMLPPGSGSGAMSPRPVDRLQFNFPHTGTGSGSADRDSQEFKTFVADNQNLIRGFFKNAQHKVAQNGQVRFTYKKQGPYKDWEVERIAGEEGWEEVSSEDFVAPKGYKHVLTKTADGTVGDDGAVTVTFRRKATDTARTSLSGAVDANDLASRLIALPQSKPVRTETHTPAPKTSYHKEEVLEGKVVKLPRTGVPGFIRCRGREDVAFFNDDILDNPTNKPIAEGARFSFIVGKDKKGRPKAIKIKVL